MRTTLTIDDDVLAAARAEALANDLSLGEVISRLARAGLAVREPSARFDHGLPTLPLRPDAGMVTLDIVNRLRDEGA